jgi:hypothetical protein
LNEDDEWSRLAKVALEKLEVEFAIRIYRNMKNVSMVWSLEGIKGDNTFYAQFKIILLLLKYTLYKVHRYKTLMLYMLAPCCAVN